jgi:hypothetical protein
MSRRIAIVGSRNFSNLSIVGMYVLKLPKTSIVVSGGARGVDQAAEATAKRRRMEVESYKPDWNGPAGRQAGFERNQTIVDAADEVVAFWDSKSSGTRDTIDRARKAGLKVTVIDENGNATVHEAVDMTPKKVEKKKKLPKGVLEGQIEMFAQPESYVLPKSALQKAAWDEYDRYTLDNLHKNYSVQQLRNRALRIAHEKRWEQEQSAKRGTA